MANRPSEMTDHGKQAATRWGFGLAYMEYVNRVSKFTRQQCKSFRAKDSWSWQLRTAVDNESLDAA